MGIKNKNTDPKSHDFGKKDIVINTKEGTLFFKDKNNNLKKLDPDKIQIAETNNSQVKLTQLYLVNAYFPPNETMQYKYLPINNTGTQVDDDSFATYNFITAPYSGKVRKVHWHFRDLLNQGHNPGSTFIQFLKTTASDYNPLVQGYVAFSDRVCGTVYSYNFDNMSGEGNTNTFDAGDLLAFRFKTFNFDDGYGMGWFQIEIEYNLLLTSVEE